MYKQLQLKSQLTIGEKIKKTAATYLDDQETLL
jgi:hypothetical protein